MTSGFKTDPSPHEISGEIKKTLSPYFRSARYFRSETLWREGETKGMLVSLIEGRVKIYRLTAEGKSVTLYIMGPGDVFGFLPLIDGGPYPVSAEAMEDINALIITHSQFLEALRVDPAVSIPLLTYLSGHLRSAFDLIMRLSSKDALPRVASAFLELLEESCSAGTGEISLPVSSKEFASILGLTPESLSRKITRLSELGVLRRVAPNRFLVTDKEKLSELSAPGIFL